MVDEFRPNTFITLIRSGIDNHFLTRYITREKTIIFNLGLTPVEIKNLNWLLEKDQYRYSGLKEIETFKNAVRIHTPRLYNKHFRPANYNE